MSKEEEIVIEDEKEQTSDTDGNIDIEGLGEGQIELAKQHGLYKEEVKEENNKKEEVKSDDDVKNDSESSEKDNKSEENVTLEDIEKDENLLKKFDKKQQAFYWKWKSDRYKRQEAQKKAEELEKKIKEFQDNNPSSSKIKKIKDLLTNSSDEVTIEQLLSIVDEQEDVSDTKKEEKVSQENSRSEQNKIMMKAEFAQKLGAAKYDNFEEMTLLAKEVSESDATGVYKKILEDSFINDDVDENVLVERVVSIARMSPKFADITNQIKSDKEVDRVLNNSKKKVSSASVNGAGGKRIISESELTVAQAAKLPLEKWNKLKEETRRRILMGIDP